MMIRDMRDKPLSIGDAVAYAVWQTKKSKLSLGIIEMILPNGNLFVRSTETKRKVSRTGKTVLKVGREK